MADFYSVSVPVLIRYLGRLDGILERLALFAESSGRSESEFLALSLTDGMFDLRRQVLIAAGFSIRTVRPMVERLRDLPQAEATTIAELRAVIGERIAALSELRPDDLTGKEAIRVTEEAGEARFETDALTFVTHYALPNFFFHLMAAFAILRMAGVPLGKADFDGFHAYPADFRFI